MFLRHFFKEVRGPSELGLRVMKKFIFLSLLLFLIVQGTGCTSMYVYEKARGTPPARDDAQPAYYSLLPLTVPLDVALVALYLYAEGHGSYSPGCSPSSGGGGLKVTRP
jgi:hypothetical protein